MSDIVRYGLIFAFMALVTTGLAVFALMTAPETAEEGLTTTLPLDAPVPTAVPTHPPE